jgi:hypothetical protein
LGAQKAGRTDADSWRLPLYQFLQVAGQLNPQDLENAVRIGTQDTEIMALMLRKAGLLEAHVIEAAIACNDLIAKKVLKTEQAIMALNHCQRTRSSIYDCFDEFGWSQPKDAQPLPPGAMVDERAIPVETIRTDRILQNSPVPVSSPSKDSLSVLDTAQKTAFPGSQDASHQNHDAVVNPEDVDQGADDGDPSKPKKKLIDLVP